MGMIKCTLLSVLSLSTCFIDAASLSQDRKPTVAFKSGNGSLPLSSKGSPVSIILDAADWPGVLRAAHDVAVDFGRVTGTNGTLTTVGSASNQTSGGSASVIFNVTGISKDWSVSKSSTKGKGVIIAGTIGNSSLIDALVKSGKLDVSKIEGEWEAYTSAVVQDPMNGTAEALVIAGTHPRSLERMKKKPDKKQEVISVARSMAFTMSLNKLVSHLGIFSQMSRQSRGRASTPSAPSKYRRHRQ